MASSLLLRLAASPSLFTKLVSPIRVVPVSASRFFKTNALVRDYDDGEDCRALFRRRHSPFHLFGDASDPFFPPRSMIQASKLMDEFMTSSILAAAQGMGSVSRRGWDMQENKDSVLLRMEMPGLGKEDVKVSVEQDTLVISGSKESSSSDESGRRYSGRIDLSRKLFKLGEIKAEMKNGVLNVVVPKATEEERKNVVEVNID